MTADLALRHVAYGVKAADYASLGEAVMSTLAEVLDEAFTPDMEEAWRQAYAAIAAVMIETAYGPGADAAA
jgi:nitric oxide dioxygenase